jgi:hypothetical protein
MALTTSPLVSSIPAHDFTPDAAPPYGGAGSGASLIAIGLGKGIGFPSGVACAARVPFRLGADYTATTGLKVDLLLADDPTDTAAKISKNAYMEATIGPITSGTTTYDETAVTGVTVGSTAVLSAITMPATLGVLKTATISIPLADLNSLAASGWACLKIRRVGTNALDTDPGRVVLLAVDIYDY